MRPTIEEAVNIIRSMPRHDVLVLNDYKEGYSFIVTRKKIERATMKCKIEKSVMTEEQLLKYAAKNNKVF